MSRYAAGTRFEHDVRRELEGKGFFVQRAPRSGGVVDLLCVRRASLGEVLMVSCKRDGECGVQEWNHFLARAERHECVPLIALRPGRGGAILFRKVLGPKSGKRGVRQPWEEWECPLEK